MEFPKKIKKKPKKNLKYKTMAYEYSRLSSLPAPDGRFARETSAIYSQKFHTDDVNLFRIWSGALIGSLRDLHN